MRLIITILILLPLSSKANEPVKRTIWDADVLDAIIQVESSYRVGVCGDSGNAVGILQLWKITVRDVNRIIRKQKYKYEDRLSRVKSIEMFYIYQRHYNPTGDLERGCRIHNGGPDGWKEKNTLKYYHKILGILNK
jgi:hypothetical protein